MKPYRLEVCPAGDSSPIENVKLLWTQLPAIAWDRVSREILPWYERMAKYGVIILSKEDYHNEDALHSKITYDIKRHTQPGDLVVDPFCGYSTVGEVALQLDRMYYGCDISQIAIDRSEVRLSAYA